MIGRWWRKATTLLGVNYALMLEYRGELFFWMIATIMPLIMMGPWMVAGASGKFPLGETDFARYFVAVFIVRQFSIAWAIYEFEFLVVSGRLSPQLLVPVDPGWRLFASHVAEHGARFPFVVGMTGLAIWLFPASVTAADGGWWLPSAGQVGLALVATYTAFFLRFLIQYTLALGALWVERIVAFDGINMLPYLFVSGLVAPLEVFPPWLVDLVLWTPYPYMVWFPARLLAGGPLPVPLWQGFAVIAGWIAGMWVLNRVLWRAGLKNYSAMGA